MMLLALWYSCELNVPLPVVCFDEVRNCVPSPPLPAECVSYNGENLDGSRG
jgi:hypothetical protein